MLQSDKLRPGISEADALSILLNEKTLSGDEASRIWGAIGIITAGYGQKLRLAGKELLALNSAEELVTSTGHVIKNAEANAIKNESRGVGKEAGKEAANAEKGTIAKISPENQKYVDILSPEAKQHILYGDSLTSGGHMYPGNPGKTTFPKDWSADKIVHEIGDIATAPNTQWYAQTGTGGIYTAKGKPANWVSYEVRNGVRIRVVYQPATGKIITAFPDNAAIPTSYKPIK
ncbi:MAG: EndoU domain-containing protein [Gilliamella sp.]|nr:EndoU domain-containing protein [Gilliamella sp.]